MKQVKFITINNKRYFQNFVDSLFISGGTGDGEYKVLRHSIILSNIDGKPFAAIIRYSDTLDYGIVNCIKEPEDKRYFYQYGLSERYAKILGVPEDYSKQREYAKLLNDQIRAM